MNELQNTLDWFKQAIPEPTIEQACVQIGCAFEETGELANTLGDDYARDVIDNLSDQYKSVDPVYLIDLASLSEKDKVQMLDDIVDEIVTRAGIAHMMGFDLLGALAEVNRSNFSKFEDGTPVFDSNGKITKGKDYTPPNLSGMVGK